MKVAFPRFTVLWFDKRLLAIPLLVFLIALLTGVAVNQRQQVDKQHVQASAEQTELTKQIFQFAKEMKGVKNQDQYLVNKQLETDIRNIESTYRDTVHTYEELLALKEIAKDTKKFDEAFTDILVLLSRRNYATAAANLRTLAQGMKQTRETIEASFTVAQNVPANNNSPPAGGYSRQSVASDIGTFLVDIIPADLDSTRVIVDTAADKDCANDCPVLSLSDYVTRNGAFAAVNGSYFCPATYPSCAEKKNSFDTLLMNKNKVYFNSDNNVYSTVPAVIFLGGSIRFVGQSLEWGRDTSPDGVIANQPFLIAGGNIVFGGDGDSKHNNKGGRSFVANRGSIVYIGVVHNATVVESAHTLKALGMENALNLDDGGSTALWYAGYKVGPGRSIPNAILFVRK